MSRIGLGRSLNAFFFFFHWYYFTKTCQGKEEGETSTQYDGELYVAFRKDELLLKMNLLILSQLVGP